MDVIQEAINQNKHISTYPFHKEQTWDTFRKMSADRDVYLYGLGNAARYFHRKYSEKIDLCGAIDSYAGQQGFCVGDYLPETVETSCERTPVFDAGILRSLAPDKTIILISNINAYETIAEKMAAYHLECFVLLLMEADGKSHERFRAQCGEHGGCVADYFDNTEYIGSTEYVGSAEYIAGIEYVHHFTTL